MPDVVVMVDPLVLLAEDVVHHRLLDVLLSIVPMHCNVIIQPDSTRSPRRDCTHTFDSAVFSKAEFHHLKKHLMFKKVVKTCGALEQIFSRLILLGGAKSLEMLPERLSGLELPDSLIFCKLVR